MQHISLNYFLLSNDVCSAIEKVLSVDNCMLKSLELTRIKVNSDADVEMIGNGIKKNKSVKCIKIDSTKDEVMKPLLASLEHGPLLPLEKVELYSHFKARGISFASAIQKMPRLRSLTIDGPRLDREAWKEIFAVAFGELNELRKLEITRGIENDVTLDDLSVHLATNETLKVLDLSENYEISSFGWCKLFKLKNTALEELHLRGVIKVNSVLTALSDFLAVHQKLRALKIPKFDYGSLSVEGWDALGMVLGNHTGLEELDMHNPISRNFRNFSNSPHHLALEYLRGNRTLKRVCIVVYGISQLRILANILKSRSCSIEKFDIRYYPGQTMGHVNLDTAEESIELTQIVVDALERNSSLKAFRFQHCDNRLFQFDWAPIYDLVCNKSSVGATFNSNHKLERLEVPHDFNSTVPLGIYSMVYFNQNTNKQVVAIDKIVHCHKLDDIDYLPSTLPLVLCRLGRSNTNKSLGQMYSIICKNRHEIPKMC
jgi:hypothetical protein